MKKYKVLDLFAGAGGLSDGFVQTGKFDIVAAVEKDKYAKETYTLNHPSTMMYDDIYDINLKSLEREIGKIDIVIGGPPCQGFSNANRQKNSLLNHNNHLVKRYVEAVLTLKPIAFVLENVAMIKSQKHTFFRLNDEKLSLTGKQKTIILGECPKLIYLASQNLLNYAMCKKITLNEKEYLLLRRLYRSMGDDKSIYACITRRESHYVQLVNNNTHSDNGNQIFELRNRVMFCIETIMVKQSIPEGFSDYITEYYAIQKVAQHMIELFENNIDFSVKVDGSSIMAQVESYSVIDYLTTVLGEQYDLQYKVLNSADFGVPQLRERFVMIGFRRDYKIRGSFLPEPISPSKYNTVHQAISDLENVQPTYSVNQSRWPKKHKSNQSENGYLAYVSDSNFIKNHIIPKNRSVALSRFKALKQGQNFHDLSVELKSITYSDIERTQNTIYRRLHYYMPSQTVVNVRKSMWVHPSHDRALSIREAARLQSFRDSYEFVGTKDSQYQQVGNAVPPLLGRSIAEQLLVALGDSPIESIIDILK